MPVDRPVLALAMAPVLTRDLFDDGHLERLAAVCRLDDPKPLDRLDDERARAVLPEVEILLTGWGCPSLDAAVLASAPRLRATVHAAGTVKNHVTEACFQRGVSVSCAAAANALPVAEYTLAAILFANKRVFRLRDRYRELRSWRPWSQEEPGLGNLDKTVGIVGASRIGRRLIELLRPFDLRVTVHDPYLSREEAGALGVEKLELDDLIAGCDVLSLHAPALAETRHLINRRRLALLPDRAVLINTARGALVDHAALTEELVSGRIDAVLDTTDPEILPADSPLYDLPNVFLTPHVAGSLGPETKRLASLAVEEVERFVAGAGFAHEVRHEDWARIA